MNYDMTHLGGYIRRCTSLQVLRPYINSIEVSESNMQLKKVLSAAAAATLIPPQANGQQLFDDASKSRGANETIYGPLKVIEIPHFPSIFENYPDMDAELRKKINNGGLDPICSECNDTGCFCPDKHSNISFNGLCEGCRATGDGALRCYCSPALDATPCGGPIALTGCGDQPEQCNHALDTYFCEPQNWDQNPGLQTLATPSVIYDFKKATVMPPGIGTLPTDPAQPGTKALLPEGAQPGSASKKGMNVGAAAVAGAAVAAWAMEPYNRY